MKIDTSKVKVNNSPAPKKYIKGKYDFMDNMKPNEWFIINSKEATNYSSTCYLKWGKGKYKVYRISKDEHCVMRLDI